MRETLWDERVFVDETPAPHSCVFSSEPIEQGEHAVSILIDEGKLTMWVALSAVDEFVETLRAASAGDFSVTAPKSVRLVEKSSGAAFHWCGLCSRSDSRGVTWLTVGGGDQITEFHICDDCFDDLADALDSVWEYGDELAAGEL